MAARTRVQHARELTGRVVPHQRARLDPELAEGERLVVRRGLAPHPQKDHEYGTTIPTFIAGVNPKVLGVEFVIALLSMLFGALAPAPEPPGHLVARVTPGATVAVRDRPHGRVVARLGEHTEFGSPQTLAVLDRDGDWLGVSTTALPNDRVGWIDPDSAHVSYARTPLELRVDLSKRTLSALRRGSRLASQHGDDRRPRLADADRPLRDHRQASRRRLRELLRLLHPRDLGPPDEAPARLGGRRPARDPRRADLGDRQPSLGRLPPRARGRPALADEPRSARDSRHDPSVVEITVRPHVLLLGLTVGIALADSSVVTIALPRILTDFDVAIDTLSWVLTSYNLALAVAAVPAAFLARRYPTRVFGVGIVVFSAASLACAFAPSIEVLIAARAAQGLAGAGCGVRRPRPPEPGGRAEKRPPRGSGR